MKKALAILVVLALCVPAMAATVVIESSGDLEATITVTAEGAVNIVGLALDIDATPGGGNITGISVSPATFNIYMDAAYNQEQGGDYVYGTGTPIANQDAVGEVAISNNFAVSVGALNGESTAGADGAAVVVITITADADTEITVTENALRGGIILTDGTGEDITGGPAVGMIETIGDCFTRYYASGTPQHDLFLSFGSPDCWCSDIHQCGDVNGDCFVTIADDIMPMVTSRAGGAPAYAPCADSNYDGFVTIADDIMTAVNHRAGTPPHAISGTDCLDGTCPTAVGIETDGVCDPQSDGDGEWILDGNDD